MCLNLAARLQNKNKENYYKMAMYSIVTLQLYVKVGVLYIWRYRA